MASTFDLPLRRDKTMIWDAVARKRTAGVVTLLDLSTATLRLVVEDMDGNSMFTLTSGTPN